MFVYIRARFCFALIGRNLTAQSTESHRRIVGGIQIPEKRRCCKLSFIFPPRRQSAERPGELARQSAHARVLLGQLCSHINVP